MAETPAASVVARCDHAHQCEDPYCHPGDTNNQPGACAPCIQTALEAAHQAGLREALSVVDSIKEPHTQRANAWSVRVFWAADKIKRLADERDRAAQGAKG